VSGLKGSLRKGEERGFPRPLFVVGVSQDANLQFDVAGDGPNPQFRGKPRAEAALPVAGRRPKKEEGVNASQN